MATLTAYATSGDGLVRNNGSSAWSTLRNAASGTVASQFNPTQVYNDGTSADKYIDRAILCFDLSSLPPNAIISAATLSVYGQAVASGAGGAVGITSASPASTTTLATSDFDDVGSTEYATRINFAALGTGAYTNFALNAAGLAYLATKLGTTAGFALRGSFDLDNSAPGTTVYSQFSFNTTDASGTSQDPKLTVTYTLVERTTGDTWGWDSPATVTGRSGGTLLNVGRPSSDTWAWSSTVTPTYRRSTADVLVTAAGPNCALSGSQNLAGASTITVDSTAGFASSGTAYVVDNTTSNQQQGVFTYTGKTSTTFTGCSFTSLIGSSTFGVSTKVGAPNAESHFPQIVALDTTDEPDLLISYTQHAGHSVKRGSLKFKISTDGGQTWGSEQTLIASPHLGSSYGIYGHVHRRLKNGRLFTMWYEHQMDYTAADSIANWHVLGSYSDDNGASWSTPQEYDTTFAYGPDAGSVGSGSGFLVYTGPGSNATYGDLYVMVMGNDDGIFVHSTPETYRTYPKLMKMTDGGASGTWTEVADMGSVSDFGGRGASEGDLCIAEDGTWVAHVRVENKDVGEDSPYLPYYQRWQMVSSDLGLTWTGHKRVNPLGNSGKIFKLPGGTLVSVGQDLNALATGATSWVSADNGATWRRNRTETTDATYAYYNGSDAEVIIDDFTVSRNTVFTWADEIGTQSGARTMFRWFVDPSRSFDTWLWNDTAENPVKARSTTDTWAWSDTAPRSAVTPQRATSDAWAWNDAATRGLYRTGYANPLAGVYPETWAWGDSAGGSVTSPPDLADTSDGWAWGGTAFSTTTHPRAVGDTWGWVDVASATATGALPAIILHPKEMVPGTPISAYRRWEWRGPVAAKLNAGPGASVQDATVSADLTVTFNLPAGEYVAYAPAYPTKRLFFMVTE